MASENGIEEPDLTMLSQDEVANLSFFQLIRRVEMRTGQRLGGRAMPMTEPLRLGAAPSSRFASSEIVSIEPTEPVSVTMNVIGLTGPSGVLPLHYTEQTITGRRSGEELFGRFLDLFNHRFASFFYRAWAKYRFLVSRERARGEEPILTSLGLGSGLGDNAPHRALSGAFQRRPSAGGIARVVEATLGAKAEVAEFQGTWIQIGPHDRTALGDSYATLGGDAVLGERSWDVSRTFAIKVGPVEKAAFVNLVSGQGNVGSMRNAIKLGVGLTVDCVVDISLSRSEAPTVRLGDTENGARLGLGTWLVGGKPDDLLSDTRLSARFQDAF
ncbi:MAG: type VI secretion system baseplate subunit TssG [Pseudomonadota bacterium]